MTGPSPGTTSPNMDVKIVSQEMPLLSNALAAFTFIADQPERAALVFVSGVCVGLLVTLCALVVQVHCRTDCHYSNTRGGGQQQHRRHSDRNHRHHDHRCHHRHGDHQHHHHHHRHPGNRDDHQGDDNNPPGVAMETSEEEESESEGWDDETTSDLSARRRRRFERTLLNTSLVTSTEEIQRSQRLEERERIIREIWMNGQPEVNTVTRSLNRYY